VKRLLWWLLTGTAGGWNRARIIMLLRDQPYNAHQISKELDLDYKTVRHHLKVLEENYVVEVHGRQKYGAIYFLSEKMEEQYDLFLKIWERIGNNKLKFETHNGDTNENSD
jgi:DNA-binding transcriptional ArsR family regulator